MKSDMVPLVRAAVALQEAYARLWRLAVRGQIAGAVQVGKAWYVPTVWVRERLASRTPQEVA